MARHGTRAHILILDPTTGNLCTTVFYLMDRHSTGPAAHTREHRTEI